MDATQRAGQLPNIADDTCFRMLNQSPPLRLRVRVDPGLFPTLKVRAIMTRPTDLRKYLDKWPYDPDHNVRLVRGKDGRQIMLVRQFMGLEQYEVEGRPDGQRPRGMESSLEFQPARPGAAK